MKEGTDALLADHALSRGLRSSGYAVRARSRDAARRKLAAAIRVPLWTLR